MSKHVSGFFGIDKMMKHWDFWDHQKCPCCQHVKEDKHHLLTCPETSCVKNGLIQCEAFGNGFKKLTWPQPLHTALSLRYPLGKLTNLSRLLAASNLSPQR
jgi:hypothetical protein